MNNQLSLFATCPKGVEDLLATECKHSHLKDIRPSHGGVYCRGDLSAAYHLCLWSRTASRVLLQLARFDVSDHDDLYNGVQAISWPEHVSASGSLAIDCNSSHKVINNSHYAMLKVKDAIIDQFQSQLERRPNIERNRPDIRINVYIDRDSCSVYLDLSGEPLHMRGYRQQAGAAPLKENLAAAILLRSNWPALAAEGRPLIDPLCGSATLLLEAAYIATDKAPGLLRDYYGFSSWKQHDAAIWNRLHHEAEQKAEAGKQQVPALIGIEKSFKVAGIARDNIRAAGFADLIEIKQADSVTVIRDLPEITGLIVTNPPYGRRIGESDQLKQLYLDLGKSLKNHFPGWNIALFTASHELAKFFGLRAHHKNTLYNGALKCTLYQYRVREAQTGEDIQAKPAEQADNRDAEMFANRLTKNLKHLRKWARREGISCYRIYDADIPQYAVAIDIYDGFVHVQEYEPPKTVNKVKAFVRIQDIIDQVAQVLEVNKSHIILKTRKRQSGSEQYQRLDEANRAMVVQESGLKFRVNLHDYLDTGLFLDHRPTRQMIMHIAKGKTFLNLFAYTGTATVYAAAGGAATTTTVDMSNTYLGWAQDNMALNGFKGEQHRFLREDCLQWLETAAETGNRYQLIFLDPPTFSNSKKMETILDIKRDHVELIDKVMALLDEQGVLIFSSNARNFKLDSDALSDYILRDITKQTTSEDFRRKPAHQCWCLARNADALKACVR